MANTGAFPCDARFGQRESVIDASIGIDDNPLHLRVIAALARHFPGAITLVTICPLTNAAVALREDPEGCRFLRNIVTMGGAVWERGNVTATAEFNICADPEAAREVVQSGIPLTLVGLDATRHKVEFTREHLELLPVSRSDVRARLPFHSRGQAPK